MPDGCDRDVTKGPVSGCTLTETPELIESEMSSSQDDVENGRM
jgi:hypothetical protein